MEGCPEAALNLLNGWCCPSMHTQQWGSLQGAWVWVGCSYSECAE